MKRTFRSLILFAAFVALAWGYFSNDLMAVGRYLFWGDFQATEKTSLADNDRFLIADSAASWAVKYAKKSAVGSGGSGGDFFAYYALVIKNNTSNPDEDIDIDAAALAVEGNLETDVDLTIDGSTTGANGMDTGSLGDDTIYYVWVIYNTSSEAIAGLLSASYSSPTMPSGYTKKRLISAFLTDGSNDLIAQKQIDELIGLNARLAVASGLTSTSLVAQSLAAVLPTGTGLVKEVLFGATNSSGAQTVVLSHDGANPAVVFGAYTDSGYNTLYYFPAPVSCQINGDNIYYRVSTGSMTLYVRAYKFSLGR